MYQQNSAFSRLCSVLNEAIFITRETESKHNLKDVVLSCLLEASTFIEVREVSDPQVKGLVEKARQSAQDLVDLDKTKAPLLSTTERLRDALADYLNLTKMPK